MDFGSGQLSDYGNNGVAVAIIVIVIIIIIFVIIWVFSGFGLKDCEPLELHDHHSDRKHQSHEGEYYDNGKNENTNMNQTDMNQTNMNQTNMNQTNMNQTKIRYYNGYWTEDDVIKNQDCLFVFGDNDVGRGKGGQAIIRDRTNAIGIPTKKYPSNNPTSFYTDSELEQNKIKIDQAIQRIIQISSNYRYVILPVNGFGTGLADLSKRAPKTYSYLVQMIEYLKSKI